MNYQLFLGFLLLGLLIFNGCVNEGNSNLKTKEITSETKNQEELIGCQYNNPPCEGDYNCIDNECILKSGCDYNNPVCDDYHFCKDNECLLKEGCQYSNPSCDVEYNCMNNECILKSGCEFHNPNCEENYDCITNLCVLKDGCNYDNPSCEMGYTCKNNNCVVDTSHVVNITCPWIVDFGYYAYISYELEGFVHDGNYDIHFYEQKYDSQGHPLWSDYDMGRETGDTSEEKLTYTMSFPADKLGDYVLVIAVHDYITNTSYKDTCSFMVRTMDWFSQW